ncbi:TetR/AcrR family transcriptional regulator [Actinocrinis sp.]|jgi:AcrR family transcriptional regulator|uniref:TetR/AcrR family transcriptional regulator n=1 Tax=Actinocrinis sp. TaxID=1920516 RepID=UPI002BD4F349|nr:TetR/AcrR family transcriptional regulator [Actinocrinis sp.]HXR72108.1 TetR/AcrR family transcriptional regulator [Actinocrinis sp.]
MTDSSSTALAATRDRLLDAAAQLFYSDGIGVGVEALCRAAGVSKRSMYQLFDSKDEVMAASLERIAPTYWASLAPSDEDDRPPRARILHVFERLEELTTSPGYRGCPFVAAAVELKRPDHPASLAARRYKDALTAFFQQEAQRAGVRDPALLAQQLTIVFDGASARAVVQAGALRGIAATTAGAILDHAGVVDQDG